MTTRTRSMAPFVMRHMIQSWYSRSVIVGTLAMPLLLGAQSNVSTAGNAAEPTDLSGYWVSVVTTLDWRFRMVVPPKGDYFGIPMTPAAVKIADAWDPAKDEAADEQCKSYGAAAIMRTPGRLHITWANDKTLRVDVDAGKQTRLFYFQDRRAPEIAATLQGESLAQWDTTGAGGLKVVTTHMRAGYLRKNGVPYGEKATLTEYFDVVHEDNGDVRLIVTSQVNDPEYLRQPYINSVQFKKEADGSRWDPTPCSARW
jgi:hypothetical protein